MNIFEIKSLRQCIENIDKFDIIIFNQSYGKEFPGFHYGTLGYGNLVAVYMGFLAIKYSSSQNKVRYIDFYKNRIHYLTRNISLCFARSTFGIESPIKILKRSAIRSEYKKDFFSFIDLKRRILHLSTDLINTDPQYLLCIAEVIKKMPRSYTTIPIIDIAIPDFSMNTKRSIGIHIRRGDFKVSNDVDFHLAYSSNTSPSIELQMKVLSSLLKEEKFIHKIDVYSDSEIDKKLFINFNSNIEINFNSIYDTGEVTMEKMIKNDILIHSNSTLSTWSSIISGQVAIYPWENTPYNAHHYFSENFRTYSNYI